MKRIIVTLTSALILISSLWGQEKVNEEPLTYSPIIKNGKRGFVDATGKIVMEPKVKKTGKFSEGLAVVTINKKVGYIDTTGKIVIEPQFEQAKNFAEDLAAVRIDKKTRFH